MNHVEAQILGFVVRLYPETFARLAPFCVYHGDFLDETLCVLTAKSSSMLPICSL